VPAADISRRINAERIVLLGWLRALLLQLAHPLIAAGVAEHSSFSGSTAAGFTRLHQTVRAMLALTFGSPDAREAALEGIRAIHRRVHGTLRSPAGTFAAGAPYSAEDPELLQWVHATLVESIVLVYERVVAPLSPPQRDRYCADSADVAIALGADRERTPRTWSAVRAYIERGYASGRILVGDDALELAGALLSPVRNRWVSAPTAPVVSLLAAGQLPAAIRRQYRLIWNGRRARVFAAVLVVLRWARRLMPARVALWKSARSGNCFAPEHGFQPPRDDAVSGNDSSAGQDINAEHRALKQQVAVLRAEHDRLHAEGGTKEEHDQHLRNLRMKIKELEHHIERLKSRRRGAP
jgi:uncharacterized protein (DUF2236 family)